MSALIWITAAYVVGTKLLDCWTTQRFVRTAGAESNALASWLMRRFGFTRVVWAIFAFASPLPNRRATTGPRDRDLSDFDDDDFDASPSAIFGA